MQSTRRTYLYLIGLVVICGIAVALSGVFSAANHMANQGTENSGNGTASLVPTALAEFVNVKGQAWRIPKGDYDFTVASVPSEYPRFISGTIDPLDVHVGDTQTMRVVLESDYPITSVIAKIEHDAGTDDVQLKLIGTSQPAAVDTTKLPYFVREDGRVVLKDDPEFKIATTKSSINSLIKNVQAESLGQYTFEGNWVVHDTHTKTYRTTFIAKNTNEKSKNIVLAWSDPVCSYSTSTTQSTITQPCSFASGIEGADGLDLVIKSGVTVTLSNTATLAFNQGKALIFQQPNPGQIIMAAGGTTLIQKGYLYYTDSDGDGYAADVQYLLDKNDPGDAYGRATGGTLKIRAKYVNGTTAVLSGYAGTGTTVGLLPTSPAIAKRTTEFHLIPIAEARPPCEWTQDDCYYGPPPPPRSPAVSWQSPNNALGVSDGVYATATIPQYSNTNFIRFTNFGLNLPSYAQVTGVSVTVRAYSSDGTDHALSARLVYYDTELASTISTTKAATILTPTPGVLPSTPTDVTFSETAPASPFWGMAFNPSIVNTSGFGVDLYVPYSNPAAGTIYIDSVKINVGFKVSGLITSPLDCADQDPNARPGQNGNFPFPINGTVTGTGGSFDYNCDGTSTPVDTTTFASGGCIVYNDKDNSSGVIGFLKNLFGINKALALPWDGTVSSCWGWESTPAPACGVGKNWYYNQNKFYTRIQNCR